VTLFSHHWKLVIGNSGFHIIDLNSKALHIKKAR